MNYAIILAAGKGSRLQNNTKAILPKQFFTYQGKPLWWHCVKAFEKSPLVHALVIVFHEDNYAFAQAQVEEYRADFSLPFILVKGGDSRQESVMNALKSLPSDCSIVAIHDAARPFIKTALITQYIDVLMKNDEISGVIPSLSISDTVKSVNNDFVLSTLPRENIKTVQTPQCFYKDIILNAHNKISENQINITDDAMAIEYIGGKILCVEGDVENKKITYIDDLKLLEQEEKMQTITTFGYDVHAYVEENHPKARPFKLATVPIISKHFLKAHSDGDVLLHALIDALLSLVSAGDIGTHFPDNSKEFENISSAILLDKTLAILLDRDSSLRLIHIDCTIIAQEPKIAPHTKLIQKTLANLLSLTVEQVSIKATTEEKLGFTGELKGIKVVCVVTANKNNRV